MVTVNKLIILSTQIVPSKNSNSGINLPQGLKIKYFYEINLFDSTVVGTSVSMIVRIRSLRKQVG